MHVYISALGSAPLPSAELWEINTKRERERDRNREYMASGKFILLIVVALIPFAMARENPSHKEASQVGKILNLN
jgi:hypothetical protein